MEIVTVQPPPQIKILDTPLPCDSYDLSTGIIIFEIGQVANMLCKSLEYKVK